MSLCIIVRLMMPYLFILMKFFAFLLILIYFTCNSSNIYEIDEKCRALMNFEEKVNTLSNAFYFGQIFPKRELLKFQRFISKFSKEKGPLTCLDYIFGI